MSKVVGIDLGTTYSAIAHIDESGIAKIIPNCENEATTPSIVYIRDGNILVGEEARANLVLEPEYSVEFIKRHMGKKDYSIPIEDKEYNPIEISSFILRKLKKDAEENLGMKLHDAVITVPAYFNDEQRRMTLEAGEMAGWKVLRLINEPTAAAIYYCSSLRKKQLRVFVYDLGGGTFDVSIVDIKDNEICVVATEGDHELGGKNFNDILFHYCAETLMNEHNFDVEGDLYYYQELFEKVEKLKCSLSVKQKGKIRISKYNLEITREKFQSLADNLSIQTRTRMNMVMAQAHMTWDDIDKVVLVGGSSRMPMVRELVSKTTGKSVDLTMNPDEVVALGAALQGGLLKPHKKLMLLEDIQSVRDISSHSLGITALRKGQEVNSIIIPKNSPYIDTNYSKEYKTIYDNQNVLDIKVTEGESESIELVKILDCYRFTGIPKRPAGHSRIMITFHHDANGILQVEARDNATDKPLIRNSISLEKLRREQKTAELVRIRRVMVLRAAMVIDVSYSMDGEELEDAKKAAVTFVKEAFQSQSNPQEISIIPEDIDPDSKMGQDYLTQLKKDTGMGKNELICLQKPQSDVKISLISFGCEARVECPFSADRQHLQRCIDALEVRGSTNLTEALEETDQLIASEPGPNKLVVLVTDGMPNDESSAKIAARKLKDSGVKIKTIGIGFGIEANLLKEIASSDADSYQLENSSKLASVFGSIAQEANTDYA